MIQRYFSGNQCEIPLHDGAVQRELSLVRDIHYALPCVVPRHQCARQRTET